MQKYEKVLTQYSDSLSDSSFNLFVELVDADIVDKLFNRIIIILALKNYCHIYLDEYVVIGGTRLHLQIVDDVLLSN